MRVSVFSGDKVKYPTPPQAEGSEKMEISTVLREKLANLNVVSINIRFLLFIVSQLVNLFWIFSGYYFISLFLQILKQHKLSSWYQRWMRKTLLNITTQSKSVAIIELKTMLVKNSVKRTGLILPKFFIPLVRYSLFTTHKMIMSKQDSMCFCRVY